MAGGIALVSGSPQAAPRIIPCWILKSVAYSEKSSAMSRSLRHDSSFMVLYSAAARPSMQLQTSTHVGRLSHHLRACIAYPPIENEYTRFTPRKWIFVPYQVKSTNRPAMPLLALCALSNMTYHRHAQRPTSAVDTFILFPISFPRTIRRKLLIVVDDWGPCTHITNSAYNASHQLSARRPISIRIDLIQQQGP